MAGKGGGVMQTKILEIRDEGTYIAALAVNMNPTAFTGGPEAWFLSRCGYPCDGVPNILLTRLDGKGQATNDPYSWEGVGRTFPAAHHWIIEHWNEISDGDVVDVQFILGETKQKKVSERFQAYTPTTTKPGQPQ